MKTITENQIEEIGGIVEKCDNLVHAALLPFPQAVKLEQSLKGLREVRDSLRGVYVAVTGDDPWRDHPRGD